MRYFANVKIADISLIRMVKHAVSGGDIEVMGLLKGYVEGDTFFVYDAFEIPVEGTETRVNAQSEAYEYMVKYQEISKLAGDENNIIGWYHSHPGYGCWLSGIDVETQKLNQRFQDPWVAIVIDPLKTQSDGVVEIGAFRTLPHVNPNATCLVKENVPEEKFAEFGAFASMYYPLHVSFMPSKTVNSIIQMPDTSRLLQHKVDDLVSELAKSGPQEVPSQLESDAEEIFNHQLALTLAQLSKEIAEPQ